MRRKKALMALCAWRLLAACETTDRPGDDDPDPMGSGASIRLEVFPEGVPSATGASANADLVAFQDGDGDWTAVAGTGGVYQLAVHADRYAVAIGCSGTGTRFYYQSVAEAGQLAATGCFHAPDTVTVAIKATGGEPGLSQIWIGDTFRFAAPGEPETLAVAKGTQDIFARGFEPLFGEDVGVRVYRGPALDIEGDQQISIDWSQARPVETYPLAITGVSDPGLWATDASYLVAGGHGFRTVKQAISAATTYATVPAALRRPGELTRVEASETRNVNPGPNEVYPLLLRSAFQQLTTPGPVTLLRGDLVAIASPTIDTDAVSQLSVTLPIPPSKLGHTRSTASFTTEAPFGLGRRQDLIVRPGWAAGASTVTLTVPDLRNLAGWTPDMELYGRTEVDWAITVDDQDQPFDAPAVDTRGVACTLIGKQTLMRQLAGGAL